MSRLTQAGPPNLSRETNFSGANGNREIFILSAELTMSRFGNLTGLIRTLMTIHNTCTYSSTGTFVLLYIYIHHECLCVCVCIY